MHCFSAPKMHPIQSGGLAIRILPVHGCFPSAYFDDLSALPPKNGGNTVIQNHREHVRLLPVTQHYELADIDTPEDMQAMEVIAAHALAK